MVTMMAKGRKANKRKRLSAKKLKMVWNQVI
jgi:hypothetical protein